MNHRGRGVGGSAVEGADVDVATAVPVFGRNLHVQPMEAQKPAQTSDTN